MGKAATCCLFSVSAGRLGAGRAVFSVDLSRSLFIFKGGKKRKSWRATGSPKVQPSELAASAKGTKQGKPLGPTSPGAVAMAQDGPGCPTASCPTSADMPRGFIPRNQARSNAATGGNQEDRGRTAGAAFVPPHLQSRDGHAVRLHRWPPWQPWGGVWGRHRRVREGRVDEAFVGAVAAPGRAGRLRSLLQGELSAREVQLRPRLPAIPKTLATGCVHLLLLLTCAPRRVVLCHHDERGHAAAAGAQRRGVPQHPGCSAAAASVTAEGPRGGRAAGDA